MKNNIVKSSKKFDESSKDSMDNPEKRLIHSVKNFTNNNMKLSKNNICSIKQLDVSVSYFYNQSYDSTEINPQKIIIGKDSDKKENYGDRNSFKKILFERDVQVENTINSPSNINFNNFVNKCCFEEKTNSKLLGPNIQSNKINEINSQNNIQSYSGFSKRNSLHEIRKDNKERIVPINFRADNKKLNINLNNTQNKQSNCIKNNFKILDSNIKIHDNYNLLSNFKDSEKKNAGTSKIKNISSGSLTKNKNCEIWPNSSERMSANKSDSKEEEKVIYNEKKNKASIFDKENIIKLSKINYDKNEDGRSSVSKIDSDSRIIKVKDNEKNYFKSAFPEKNMYSTMNLNFKNFTVFKNKNDKIKSKTFITEKALVKPVWENNSSYLEPIEKSFIDKKIEIQNENIQSSIEKPVSPEVIKLYNKIFEKKHRRLIEAISPNLKDNEKQKKKHQVDGNKPSYLDEKIKDIKTKIFFLKGIFDFAYPKIVGEKIKIKKEYQKKMIINFQKNQNFENFNKRKSNAKKDKNMESCDPSEIFCFKKRVRSSQNIYPRIFTPLKSEVKIKTQKMNLERNTMTSDPKNNKGPKVNLTNLDKFYNFQNSYKKIELIC